MVRRGSRGKFPIRWEVGERVSELNMLLYACEVGVSFVGERDWKGIGGSGWREMRRNVPAWL